MCAFGEPIGAQDALAAGIVDRDHRRRSALRRHRLRARSGRAAPTQDARAQREARRTRTPRSSSKRASRRRKTRRGQTAPARRHRRGRSGHRAPLRRGLRARGGTVRPVPVLHPVQGADPRLLRRARRRQNSRRSQGHPGLRNPARGCDRRGHHGRRHHHELRQCRHSGHRQRDQPGSPRPRHGDHPQELREQRAEGQALAGGDGSAASRSSLRSSPTTASTTPTSSPRRSSKAWR